MFRQGLLVIFSLSIFCVAVLLLAGCFHAQKGKAKLVDIQPEIREAGGKLTFEDFDIEPGEVETEDFIEFKKLISEAKKLHRDIEEKTGRIDIGTDFVAKEYAITTKNSSLFGINKGVTWEDMDKNYQPVRRLWEKAVDLLSRGDVRYVPAYDQGLGAKTFHVSLTLDLVRVGRQLIFIELQKENYNKALKYYEQLITMNKHIVGNRRYSLIEGLVTVTLDGVYAGITRQFLIGANLNLEEINKLRKLVQPPKGFRDLFESIQGERAIHGSKAWNEMIKSNSELAQLFAGYEFDSFQMIENDRNVFHVSTAYVHRKFFIHEDYHFYLSCMWGLENLSMELLNGTVSYLDAIEKIDEIYIKPQSNLSGLYSLLNLTLPGMDLAIQKMVFMESLIRQSMIAIELERYKIRTSKYPEKLSGLSLPEDIDLRDIITLQPMQYRRENDGQSYTLYSVGSNNTDDGGELVPQGRNDEGVRMKEDTTPDWIWPKVVFE